MEAIVQQKVKLTYWQAFVYTTPNTRQFFCNAISFNNQGTGNLYINDVYLLQPGDTLNLNCDQNEIDATVYKMSFIPGFINKLAVMYKINEGSTVNIQNNLAKMISPGNRRQQIKNYVSRRNRGDF